MNSNPYCSCTWIVQKTKYTVHVLFTHCSCTVYGPHGTIHTFKNYLLQYFLCARDEGRKLKTRGVGNGDTCVEEKTRGVGIGDKCVEEKIRIKKRRNHMDKKIK